MRGHRVPSFYNVMLEQKVKALIDAALAERPDLFLLEFTVRPGNQITVVIDGDRGVSVEDCVFMSRAIEHNCDREEVDFSLEVTSAGVFAPLKLPRQFYKNIGRTLEVKTSEDTIKGELMAVEKKGISLNWKARKPKPQGKGKVTVQMEAFIPFETIEKAKVLIKF